VSRGAKEPRATRFGVERAARAASHHTTASASRARTAGAATRRIARRGECAFLSRARSRKKRGYSCVECGPRASRRRERFCAKLRLTDGEHRGVVLAAVEYEDITKAA